MTRQQRAQYLPVMMALLKVMETSKPNPDDVNTLLILSRDLMKNTPKGQTNMLGAFGGGFGLDGIDGMGLSETGDPIVDVDGVPHINTQFGLFPLSDTSFMTDEERREFLPVSKTFTSILQKDNLDAFEMNLLLDQSRILTEKLSKSGKGIFGGVGGGLGALSGSGGLSGFGVLSGLGGFSGLGALSGSKGVSGLGGIVRSASIADSSTSKYDKFLLPETGDHIVNVPGQGPSFNTALGKLPLGDNIMTPEERAQWLPVMKALLKVMETDKPAPSDINDLLVITRNLQKYAPKGSNNFGGFANIESMEDMGLPETGDIIKTIGGEAHIVTKFGSFPLSKLSLMTDAERQQYLPSVRTFISVLEKETLDADEMNTLLAQSRELIKLIPENFLSQFKNGLNGLG